MVVTGEKVPVRTYISDRAKKLSVSGARVIFDKAEQIKDCIRLEMGEPDFDTPDHIKQAAKEALDNNYTHYSSNRGFLDLREAISDKLRTDNRINADPRTEVIVTSGAVSALNLSFLATLNSGDEVLVPDPAWSHYESCILAADGRPVRYPLYESDQFRPRPENIRDRITEKTKMILLNTPSNPGGAVIAERDLRAIANIAEQRDLLVVSDEVYEKLVYDGMKHYSIASLSGMKDRVITINAFSKTYAMTGWRLGYATASKEIVDQMAKLNSHNTTCANTIAQKAGVVALRGPQDCVKQMVAEYQKRRNYLTKRLNDMKGISCIVPNGSFYVFPNVSSLGLSSFDFTMFLLENAHVSVVSGNSFGLHGEGHVRLSYASSMKNLETATERIISAINKLNPR